MNNNMNKDNIVKKKKPKPSKAKDIVKIIFFINYKILSYLINILLTVLLVAVLTGGICVGALLLYVTNHVDDTIADLELIESESQLTTTIYYMEYEDKINKTNGKWVPWETLHGSENRTWVKYHDTPEHLQYAFVALEDKRFFDHNGVDWGRTLRAVQNYLMPSGRTFGASTISQQLVKLMTGDDDVTVDRKIKEVMRAMALDAKSSKQDILEAYMNSVFFSHGLYGVQAAANFYFSKDVSELTLIECVSIAAIVQAPSSMHPLRPPAEGEERNRNAARRDAGLEIMLEEGFITQEEFDEAYGQELVINRSDRTHADIIKNYFIDLVIEDVIAAFVKEHGLTREMAAHRIFSGGLSIYVTMDKDIQDVMENVYIERHNEFFPQQAEGAIPLQSSMVILDPKNNNVLGIVGGRGEKTVARGYCRASFARRQPGSSIKPISVYGPALEAGIIDWGTPLKDTPYEVINGRNWPSNAVTGGYEGVTTLVRAIQISKNAAAVHVLDQLTPEYSFQFLTRELNVKSLVEKEVNAAGQVHTDVGLGQLGLGGLTYGITNLELTAAFGMFTNDGIFTKPRSFTRVLDPRGNVLINNQPERNAVLSAENAYIMTRLLQNVVDFGTARGLGMRSRIQVAGKTGTTNSEKDLWFVGYTPYYLCGIWFGYDDPTYIGRGRGNPHLTLFNSVMDYIHQPFYGNPLTFEQPDTVIQARYCVRSGMAPNIGVCGTAQGYYAKGYEPSEICDYCSAEPEEAEEEEIEETTEPATEPPPETIRHTEVITTDDWAFPLIDITNPPEIITEAPQTEPPPEEITEPITTEAVPETEPQTEPPPPATDDENLVRAE